MHCNKAQRLMLAMTEAKLGGDLLAQVQQHLLTCAACARVWDFTQKSVSALQKAPRLEVPPEIWSRIKRQITLEETRRTQPTFSWWQRLTSVLEEISWGERFAFSSAFAVALAVLIVWGTHDLRQQPLPQVVELSGNPVSAFPTYLREHHNPAGQPISEGPMVLAFNTLRDSNN